jgi:anti-sigma B factor antagonist
MTDSPDRPGHNDLEWEDASGVTVVRFKTRALRDELQINRAFGQLERLTDEGRRRLVLDFAPVEVFASLAVGKLVGLNKRLRGRGGRLALCRPTAAIREVLGIMNLARLLNVYDSEPEALASFGDGPPG